MERKDVLHWLCLIRCFNTDSKDTTNWPPSRPWPSWPSSWGPACSSRGGAKGGAEDLHRWWCCAPGAGGQTCGRIHRLPQRQTYLFLLLPGWTRCHKPSHTEMLLKMFFPLHVCSTTQCRHTRTSLSWAISWVFTCPDTRLTRPNTWPVSSPQIVQVVSMLEVPADESKRLANQPATT